MKSRFEHPSKIISVDTIDGLKINADYRTTFRVAEAIAHALFNVEDGLFRTTGNIN